MTSRVTTLAARHGTEPYVASTPLVSASVDRWSTPSATQSSSGNGACISRASRNAPCGGGQVVRSRSSSSGIPLAEFIVKYQGWYFEWCPHARRPTTCLLTKDEFRDYVLEEYGRRGLLTLPERLMRVEMTGHSMPPIYQDIKADFIERVLADNRAGADGEKIRVSQLMDWLMDLRDDMDTPPPHARCEIDGNGKRCCL